MDNLNIENEMKFLRMLFNDTSERFNKVHWMFIKDKCKGLLPYIKDEFDIFLIEEYDRYADTMLRVINIV